MNTVPLYSGHTYRWAAYRRRGASTAAPPLPVVHGVGVRFGGAELPRELEAREQVRAVDRAALGRDGALSDPPALLTHRKPLAKCARLVGELRRAGVSTAAALRLRLAADPSFLRGAPRPWVKADAPNALREGS